MIKSPKKPEDVKDEPGSEERFAGSIKKSLETPPESQEELKAERRAKKR